MEGKTNRRLACQVSNSYQQGDSLDSQLSERERYNIITLISHLKKNK